MPSRHKGEWRYSSKILDLGTTWRWVVSFTPRPLYLTGNCPFYLLDRRLDEPQSWSVRCGKEKNLGPAGIWTPAVQPLACCYTEWDNPTHNNNNNNNNNAANYQCSSLIKVLENSEMPIACKHWKRKNALIKKMWAGMDEVEERIKKEQDTRTENQIM
jgi:hypothetical protein